MDQVQRRQSNEYQFPYHYLARLDGDGFSSYRNWNWSLNYVCALKLVADKLSEIDSSSHIDIGCGDGALVHHLRQRFQTMRLVGLDYDERAVALARIFTPDIAFESGDINGIAWAETFESATLVEVIEHIPPAGLRAFMAGVHAALAEQGMLIVTVPHANKRLEAKHYQHFTFANLSEVLSEHFEVIEMFGFERLARWKGALRRAFDNPFIFTEIKPLNRLLLASELRFRADKEGGCGRIFAVARAKPRLH